MRTVGWVLAVVVAASGCGGEDEPTSCAPRTGLYKQTFERLTGTCPAIGDSIVSADSGGTPSPALSCMNFAPTPAANACAVKVDQLCVLDSGESLVMRGTAHWNVAGSTCSGEFYFEARDSNGFPDCTGTYRLRMQRN